MKLISVRFERRQKIAIEFEVQTKFKRKEKSAEMKFFDCEFKTICKVVKVLHHLGLCQSVFGNFILFFDAAT